MTKRAVRAHDGRVVCLGELLIDFVSMHHGSRLADATSFVRAAGGAPANVAVALARLGCPAAFISKTGADEFGHFLRETLRGNGVDVSGIVSRAGAPTALAFVSLSKEGERDFLFYRVGQRGGWSQILCNRLQQKSDGGSVWESNPPSLSKKIVLVSSSLDRLLPHQPLNNAGQVCLACQRPILKTLPVLCPISPTCSQHNQTDRNICQRLNFMKTNVQAKFSMV